MKKIAIVDTSIFCEILNIPHMNSSREKVIQDLEKLIEQETSFLLPMASVYETGNHIAQLSDGRNRRRYAEFFIKEVHKAINGDSPWIIMKVPTLEEIGLWLNEFPDSAMQEIGMGDLSIIKEWEKTVDKNPNCQVFIWSLDNDLIACNYQPKSIL